VVRCRNTRFDRSAVAMSGRFEKLLRVFSAQMTARHRAQQDNSDLPFTDAEFAALIRSPHPDAMKLLANGLARSSAQVIRVRPAPRVPPPSRAA
jgi:hypothetical protein